MLDVTDNTDLSRVDLTLPTDISGTVPSDAHWQRKLEAAQNVIFCKEVFQQVCPNVENYLRNIL